MRSFVFFISCVFFGAGLQVSKQYLGKKFGWNKHVSSRNLSKERYLKPVFSHVHSRTITYFRDEENPLRLDYYWPKGDAENKRPLIIYVHGGGFSGGQKDDPFQVQFAQRMAKRGFSVASISYRLSMKGKSFSCDQAAKNKIRTFKYATEDIWKATHFILKRAPQFGIDKNKIILAGSSAGAEAILHAAYWTNKNLKDLNTTIRLPTRFKYAGLISMAGAIVDTGLITKKNAVPSLLFHGSCDELVPFGSASHHYCEEEDKGFLMLHGANSIATRLSNLDASYWLLAQCGGAHEWNYLPMKDYVQGMSEAIVEMVIYKKKWQRREIIAGDGGCKIIDGLDCGE